MFGHDPRLYTTTVKEFVMNKKGELCKAVLQKLEGKRDEKTGRMMMVPIEGSEETVKADTGADRGGLPRLAEICDGCI